MAHPRKVGTKDTVMVIEKMSGELACADEKRLTKLARLGRRLVCWAAQPEGARQLCQRTSACTMT